MQGFQITFFTRLDQKHGDQLLSEWLMLSARELGIRGATIFAASEEQTAKLFSLLKAEKIDISYIKTPVEFGSTGE